MTCSHALVRALSPTGDCVLCVGQDDGPGDFDLAEFVQHELRRIDAHRCRTSLAEFTRRYWPAIAGTALADNVATDALTAALQAVADGRLRRLLIEIGPGTGKSSMLALYAAWRLARDPAHRSIHGSHSFDIAAEFSRRTRRLVESDDYRSMFGITLRSDENRPEAWATTLNGAYFAVGTGGSLTGRRAVEAVIDDPMNAPDYYSKAARNSCESWFREALSTRLDGEHAPIIVCAQRLGVDDLIGRLRADGSGVWQVLSLPAEYDARRPCVIHGVDGASLWRDPRTIDGELLAPTILSQAKLEALRVLNGSSVFASQYNQHPSSDESSTVRRSWWRFHRPRHVPENARRPAGCDTDAPSVPTPDAYHSIVIACDLTFGSVTGDYAVAAVWGSVGGARYLIEQWRQRAGFEESLVAIQRLAAAYPGAKIVIEKAAHGAAVIETLQRALPNVIPQVPQGSKAQRLSAVAPQIESGACHLPLGAPWLDDYVEELSGATKHDDAQDATVYALLALQTPRSNADFERGWML